MHRTAELRILAAAATVIASAATAAVLWCPPAARAEPQPPVSHAGQDDTQMDAETPLRLEMSLSQETFGHGEPLLLAYTLHNASDRWYEYDLGLLAAEWFSLTLRDPQGNVVPLKKDFHSVIDPYRQRQRGRLDPKGKYTEERLCLNRWLTFPSPGVYELTVQARVPFLEDPPRTTGRIFYGEEAEAHDARFTKAPALTTTRVFRLRVLPTTTDALRATARDLQAAYRKTSNRNQVLLDALFAMPWDAASPVWKEMMEQDGTGITTLLKHQSIAAVDFVARIAWSRTSSDSVRKLAQTRLEQQYANLLGPAPERVADRIRHLFARHGKDVGPRPKSPLLPDSWNLSP